jgi:hypothetical protein
MTDEERWLPVPGHVGAYEVSSAGRVRSLPRVVVRRNGARYTCQARILHLKPHVPSGRLMVTLASHGSRSYRYVHKLTQDVFGEEAA